MFGGLASMNSQRICLVLIFSLACMLMDSSSLDCSDENDGWCHLSLDEQQCIWNTEAFHFIYGHWFDGGYFGPWYYFDYPYHTTANYGPAYERSARYNAARNGSSGSNGSIVYNYANYWLKNADQMYITGSYDKAALSYARAVQLNPFLLDGWINMGNALYFLGKYEEALSAYDAALGLEPQNTNALMGRRQALAALNRTNEAGTSGSPGITEIGSLGSTATPAAEPVIVGTHPQI